MTIPVGSIVNYSMVKAPNDTKESWFVCNGQVLDRTTNKGELFGVIGGAFGDGDKVTTFALPDLRGRFVRGADMSPYRGSAKVDPNAAERTEMAPGGSTGAKVGSVQPSACRQHAHMIVNRTLSADDDGTPMKSSARGASREGWFTDPWGGAETRPANAAFSYLILAGESKQRFPLGAVIGYGGSEDPPADPTDGDRWMVCDGRPVSTGTGAELTLPDLRGLFLRAKDAYGPRGEAGRDPEASLRLDPIAGKPSTLIGSIQKDEFQAHAHGLSGAGRASTGHHGAILAGPIGGPASETEQSGAGTGDETRPINVYLHYIMRVA